MLHINKLLLFTLLFLPAVSMSWWTEYVVDSELDGAYAVDAADIDGDGDMDLVGAAYRDNHITWYENVYGDGSLMVLHLIAGDFDAWDVSVGDIDGDGDVDVTGAALSDDATAWWENINGDGSTWQEHIIDPATDGARSVYTADIDGDEDIDVLGAARDENVIQWWENTDGSGLTWIEHVVVTGFDRPTESYAADMDGDGDLDVLGAATFDNIIAWWENVDGYGTDWIPHIVATSFAQAKDVHAADMDNDGDMDVLGAAYSGDILTWWDNTNGTGTEWIENVIDGNYESAWALFPADIDNDGDMDVIGAGTDICQVTLYENLDGLGIGWNKLTLSDTFFGARDVMATDVDGDDDLDVIAAAKYADRLSWWEQPGTPGVPDLVDFSLTSAGSSLIPATGGVLEFDVSIFSNLVQQVPVVWFWTEIQLPNGNWYNQVLLQRQFVLPPLQLLEASFMQTIPGMAPAGFYQFYGFCGLNPGGTGFRLGDGFSFSKTTGIPANDNKTHAKDWSNTGTHFVPKIAEKREPESSGSMENTPNSFHVHGAYPNPFNTSSSVVIELPERTRLSVRIHDITGRIISSVADEEFGPGMNTFLIDLQNKPSGVYFLSIKTEHTIKTVQKLMLVK